MIRPLYKSVEPFMEVPKGYGYLGVIQYDDVEDKVQCHICGKWFKSLGGHSKKHGINNAQYRDRFSLPIRGGLTSIGSTKKRSAIMSQPENLKKFMKNRIDNKGTNTPILKAWLRRRVRASVISRNRLYLKNKIGLCPAQIKARFMIVQNIAKEIPSSRMVRKYDYSLYKKLSVIGFNKWKETNGIKTYRQCVSTKTYSNIDLITRLRKWAIEHKKTPSQNSFGKSKINPYKRAFGSWQTALAQAGLK